MKISTVAGLVLGFPAVLPCTCLAQRPTIPITGDVLVRTMRPIDQSAGRPNQVYLGTVVSAVNSNVKPGAKVGMKYHNGALQIIIAPIDTPMTHTTSAIASVSAVPAGGTVCFSEAGRCAADGSAPPTAAAVPTAPSRAVPPGPSEHSKAAISPSSHTPATLAGFHLGMTMQEAQAVGNKLYGKTKAVTKSEGNVILRWSGKQWEYQITVSASGAVSSINLESFSSGLLAAYAAKNFGKSKEADESGDNIWHMPSGELLKLADGPSGEDLTLIPGK